MWRSTIRVDTYPEEDIEILFVSNGYVFSGYYEGYDGAHHVWKSSRNRYTFWDTEVTHWMPLPEPPKDDIV